MGIMIVGELINTSRKAIKEAVEIRDAAYIQKVALEQEQAGAHYIDVNCGTRVNDEEETMAWLVNTVQEVITNTPLCIDSPNHKAIKVGLELHKNGQPMVNSITAEKERFANVLPLIKEYKTKVVALLMSDAGMPDTAEDRIKVAEDLLPRLLDNGIPADDIYLDPLIKPISTGHMAGQEVLQTISYIKEKYPEVHMICGLSNVSYGLPNRKYLNRAFTINTMSFGMDSYILNPLDKESMRLIFSSQALLGRDPHCKGFLKAHRKGLFED
jgi:cobalamin-dependent methionine synthase I